MNRPDYKGAIHHAVEQLEKKLPIIYTYHSLKHTQNEVVVMAEHLSDLEGVDGEERKLLLTAAYYHDIGFIQRSDHHELVSIEYIHQVLPEFGYDSAQINVVQGIILATRIPQRPNTLLEEIVVDADLDALGRVDFWNRNLALRYEMAMLGYYYSDIEWCERQQGFLNQHHYFTSSARQLRGNQKRLNYLFLQECCQECHSEKGLPPGV